MNLIKSLRYINKSISKKAYLVTPNTATFDATIATSPSDFLPVNNDFKDFIFFVNGIFINEDIIISFIQSGTDVVLTIDSNQADWLFKTDDEIIAIGKFN